MRREQIPQSRGGRAIAMAAVVLLCTAASSLAAADLLTEGRGRGRTLVREQFPPDQQTRYDLFAERCTQCHVMARPIAALTTGITPVTGGDFDEQGIRRYVVRMMRKPNSGIDRGDARDIILFLNFARGLAREPAQAEAE